MKGAQVSTKSYTPTPPTPEDVKRTQADETEVRTSGGNVAIRLDSGELLDVNYTTLSNLARMGESQFQQALTWLTATRARRAEVAAEREAEQEAFRQALRAKQEARQAVQDEQDARPATIGDLRRARI
jgi:hypothetical protein